MNVVLDTNVLVSALISPFGHPARIVELVLLGELALAYDDRLMAEYRDVLARPRFGFDPDEVDALLLYIRSSGQAVTAPPLTVEMPDAHDVPFLEVAAATDSVLVTGNARHYPAAARGTATVQSPAEFWAAWQGRGP